MLERYSPFAANQKHFTFASLYGILIAISIPNTNCQRKANDGRNWNFYVTISRHLLWLLASHEFIKFLYIFQIYGFGLIAVELIIKDFSENILNIYTRNWKLHSFCVYISSLKALQNLNLKHKKPIYNAFVLTSPLSYCRFLV